MDFESFKRLSREDAFVAAGKIAGVDPSIFDGMWKTESARGQAMLSPAGAEGHFGLMPKTRALFEKRVGSSIDPHDFNQSLYTAALHLKDDLGREKGDIVAALRAYNNGPNWRNQKDPRGENAAYAQKVLGKQPEATEVITSTQGQRTASQETLSAYDPALGSLGPIETRKEQVVNKLDAELSKVQKQLTDAATQPVSPINREPVNALANGAVKQQAQADSQRAIEVDETSFLDRVKSASPHVGITPLLLRKVYRERFSPDENFVLPEEELRGYSSEEIAYLDESVSAQDFSQRKAEIAVDREDMDMTMRGSTAAGLGAMLFNGFADAPAWALGLGVTKSLYIAGKGSMMLAQQGKKGAALASNFAENTIANVGALAVEDVMGGYVGQEDYAVGLLFGIAPTALLGTQLGKLSQNAPAMKAVETDIRAAVQNQEKLAQKAIASLGPEADIPAVRAKMQADEVAEITERNNQDIAALPPERQLLPELDVDDEGNLIPVAQGEEAQSPLNFPSLFGEAEINTRTAPEDVRLNTPVGRSVIDAINLEDLELRSRAIPLENTKKADGSVRVGQKELFGAEKGFQWVDSLAPGTHVSPRIKGSAAMMKEFTKVADTAEALRKQFFPPGMKVIVDVMPPGSRANQEFGVYRQLGPNLAVLKMVTGPEWQSVLAHEMGHGVLMTNLKAITRSNPSLRGRLEKMHRAWLEEYKGNTKKSMVEVSAARSPIEHAKRPGDPKVDKVQGGSLFDYFANTANDPTNNGNLKLAREYFSNFDEFMAEQFAKYLEAGTVGVGAGVEAVKSLPRAFISAVADMIRRLKDVYDFMVGKKLLAANTTAEEFFEAVRKQGVRSLDEQAGDFELEEVQAFMRGRGNAVPGLDNLPDTAPSEKTDKILIKGLWTKARQWAADNPIDPERLAAWTKKGIFNDFASSASQLLQSKNPVARMIAGELLESSAGAAGRRSTAASAKYINERKYLGNLIPEYEHGFAEFRRANKVNLVEGVLGNEAREQYGKLIRQEIESRRQGGTAVQSPAYIKKAADSVEQAFDRMRLDQLSAKTIGYQGLPKTSKGYLPQIMSQSKIISLDRDQQAALIKNLRQQFITKGEMDEAFADTLARRYVERVRQKALGGFTTDFGNMGTSTNGTMQEVIDGLNITRAERNLLKARFMGQGAGFTKNRLELDLNAKFKYSDGRIGSLADLFDNDILSLVRNQSQRISGEVALARHGIKGKPGLQIIRRAMEIGEGQAATAKELETFDMVAAEFLGEPFGTQSKNAQRLAQVTSLTLMGGMGLNEIGNYINHMYHLGLGSVMQSLSSFGRLRAETKALARGQAVPNSILNSLETVGGAQFGTDARKFTMPFDANVMGYELYGRDSVTAVDKLLRGGNFLQGKLSLWRTISTAQARGAAEQITLKSLRYLNEGKSADVILKGMGFTDDLMARLRADLSNIATFDASGRPTSLDLTKSQDTEAVYSMIQAVHRGTAQIMNNTFIGETGKWIHNDYLKLLTQFRSFSINSIEKQWRRSAADHGAAKAVFMLMGTMVAAVPLYLARVQLQAQGRSDKEEYLEKRMSPYAIFRGSMNYVAAAGLAGDLMDLTTVFTGQGVQQRSGGTDLVGGVIAPSASVANDAFKALQNTKDGMGIHDVVKTLPFSRLPFMIPVVNSLKE